MPGQESYGAAGKWIHDRAHRIMEESPGISKSVAYATATQQGHKVGKSPKSFRTTAGVAAAKDKYTLPKKEYQKTAGSLAADAVTVGGLLGGDYKKDREKTSAVTLTAFFDELEQIEKEANWKSWAAGLGLVGALGGGVKAALPNIAHAATKTMPAATQVIKKQMPKLMVGSASQNAKLLQGMGL